MIHIGLFEGIGGFSLAAQWAGWETYATCEINPFGQKVLKYYWPNAYHHSDIHTLTYELLNKELIQRFGTDWRNDNIIVTGGFPCQPYSAAGKRLGKEDERHLWPEMLRTIREIQPTWVVGENVSGLVNWNGGMVFDEVQSDLEVEGYETIPFLLPACGKNAPHKRERIFFVAKDTKRNGFIQRESKQERTEIREQRNACTGDSIGICLSEGTFTNATSQRHNQRTPDNNRPCKDETGHGFAEVSESDATNTNDKRLEREASNGNMGRERFMFGNIAIGKQWDNFPTQSPVCSGNDGISRQLDGITFPKWRNESIKAYGNAIVPAVFFEIAKAINTFNSKI